MKKKILVCLLIAVLMLGLSGCGFFELSLARAVKNMVKVQSFRSDFRLNLDMDVSLLKDTWDVSTSAKGTAAVTLHPFRIATDLFLESIDDESVKLVISKGRSDLDVYYSIDEGARWKKKETDISFPSSGTDGKISAVALLKIAQLGKGFKKAGTKTVHGSQAEIWSGSVSGADLANILKESGWGGFRAEGVSITSDTFRQISKIPIRIGINTKSGMITYFSIDFTSFTRAALRELIVPIIQEKLRKLSPYLSKLEDIFDLDWDKLGFELSINKTTLEMELYDFDKVGSIAIPTV